MIYYIMEVTGMESDGSSLLYRSVNGLEFGRKVLHILDTVKFGKSCAARLIQYNDKMIFSYVCKGKRTHMDIVSEWLVKMPAYTHQVHHLQIWNNPKHETARMEEFIKRKVLDKYENC